MKLTKRIELLWRTMILAVSCLLVSNFYLVSKLHELSADGNGCMLVSQRQQNNDDHGGGHDNGKDDGPDVVIHEGGKRDDVFFYKSPKSLSGRATNEEQKPVKGTRKVGKMTKKNQLQQKKMEEEEDMKMIMPARRNVTKDPQHSFSACMLLKDDNDRLTEWIAYHYTTLPLRRLIVAVDPTSTQSPEPVVRRWTDMYDTYGLNIDMWTNDSFVPGGYAALLDRVSRTKNGKIRTGGKLRVRLHRERQGEFIGSCLTKLRDEGRKWVLLVDVDEYLVFNRAHIDDPKDLGHPWMVGVHRFNHTEKIARRTAELYVAMETRKALPKMGEVGNLTRDEENLDDLRVGHKMESDADGGELDQRLDNDNDDASDGSEDGRYGSGEAARNSRSKNKKQQHNDTKAETAKITTGSSTNKNIVIQYTTPAEYLHHTRNDEMVPWSHFPCVVLPRLFFPSKKESKPRGYYASSLFPPKHFDTLTYRSHPTPRGRYDFNLYGKPIIDVSRLPIKNDEPLGKVPPHRPFRDECDTETFPPYSVYPFRIQHYLGSYEAYSARKDDRRSETVYNEKNDVPYTHDDDDIRPWVDAFVSMVGKDEAVRLVAKKKQKEGEEEKLGMV